MKKSFALMLGCLAVLGLSMASCSNDDDDASYDVTFRITTATVVDGLYEWNAGDLTALYSDEQLNVRLFIYNSSGKLVYKDTEAYGDYSHKMTSSTSLEEGSYYAVACTDITSDDVHYWEYSGTDDISTFTIINQGYLGGDSKILGMAVKKFSVSGTGTSVAIDVERAGVVVAVYIANWKSYTLPSGYTHFAIGTNRTCESVGITNGSIDYSIDSSNSMSWIFYAHKYDSSYTGGVGYQFIFPVKNASFQLEYAKYGTTGWNGAAIGATYVMSFSAGKSYLMVADCSDGSIAYAEVSDEDMAPAPAGEVCNSAAVYNAETRSISINAAAVTE